MSAGPNAGIPADSPLALVFDIFARATKQPLQTADGLTSGARSFEGVLLKDFVEVARKELWYFYGHRHGPIVAGLAARGLLTAGSFDFLQKRQRRAWTDTGREAADELDEWLRTGRARLGDWVSEEPQRAFAYTSGAGATILLMDDRYPEFALLDEYLRWWYAWLRETPLPTS